MTQNTWNSNYNQGNLNSNQPRGYGSGSSTNTGSYGNNIQNNPLFHNIQQPNVTHNNNGGVNEVVNLRDQFKGLDNVSNTPVQPIHDSYNPTFNLNNHRRPQSMTSNLPPCQKCGVLSQLFLIKNENSTKAKKLAKQLQYLRHNCGKEN